MTTTLHKDAACRIYEGEHRIIHVKLKGGQTLVPQPALYPGFTNRDFASLRRELLDSGIPAAVVSRWMRQAEGYEFT